MTSRSTSPASHRTRTTLEDYRRSRTGEAIAAAQRPTTHEASIEGPMSAESLVVMLRTIDDFAAGADQLDSAELSRSLGWTAARTAAALDEAKGRLLLWAIRAGGSPAPCFEDIELTVQGRRLVRAAADGRLRTGRPG